MIVLSTGFNAPTKQVCLDSVQAQTVRPREHRYIEASWQDPPKTVLENVWVACQDLPKDEVIAWVDGDDFLASRTALATIANTYDEHPEIWVTYGSYITTDGLPGVCSVYGATENVRSTPWRASHLKTFRAGLLQKVDPKDLQKDGEWVRYAADQGVMFPIIEMAGWDRTTFVPDILVIYNYSSSYEANTSSEGITAEREASRHFRSLKPYARLEAL